MTSPRLAGLAVDVADHPVATSRLFGALGLHVATLDELAEIRLDSGTVLRLRHSEAPTRIALRLAVPDLAAVALALGDHRTPWTTWAPNVIRIERGGLTVDVTEADPPGLASVTMSVSDVAATAQWWRTLGMPVTDTIPAADADPADPAEPAADVQLGGMRFQLRGCGLQPVTMAHMVIRVEDPLDCCVGLDYAGWEYRRDGEALVMRTPDGCGVRLAPQRR